MDPSAASIWAVHKKNIARTQVRVDVHFDLTEIIFTFTLSFWRLPAEVSSNLLESPTLVPCLNDCFRLFFTRISSLHVRVWFLLLVIALEAT